MNEKPTIAVAIFALGSLGLFAASVLAVLAFMDPPRGVSAPIAALAYLPHAFGALIVIGFGELIAYVAELVEEAKRARRETGRELSEIRKTIEAQALAAEERELPRDLLDRAHQAGWAIEAKGQGQWTAASATGFRNFPHRGALEDFIRTLPASG